MKSLAEVIQKRIKEIEKERVRSVKACPVEEAPPVVAVEKADPFVAKANPSKPYKVRPYDPDLLRTKQVWKSMKSRCQNPKVPTYRHYGGRGIKVCDQWQAFEGFFKDVGIIPKGLSIDRIDNDGNYEPGNVRFADAVTQANNRRPRTSKRTALPPSEAPRNGKRGNGGRRLSEPQQRVIWLMGNGWRLVAYQTGRPVLYNAPREPIEILCSTYDLLVKNDLIREGLYGCRALTTKGAEYAKSIKEADFT